MQHRATLIAFYIVTLLIITVPAQADDLWFGITLSAVDVELPSAAFGLRAQAAAGLDAFDVPEPPAVPGSPIYAYFSMQTPPTTLPNRWRCDYRAIEDYRLDRLAIWELTVEAPGAPTTIDIGVEALVGGELPFRLWLQGPGSMWEVVEPSCQLSVPVEAAITKFYWILEVADEVDVDGVTWGNFKSRFLD